MSSIFRRCKRLSPFIFLYLHDMRKLDFEFIGKDTKLMGNYNKKAKIISQYARIMQTRLHFHITQSPANNE